MPYDTETILADMVTIAREAGALTLGYFKRFRELEIGIKGPADFVSEADKESELLIRKFLFERYPDWSFTGEEFPPVDKDDQEHRWLVDPIDGTTNFINGMHYTISLALRRGNETLVGVLYNPPADEMFTAIKGQGAFMNGERLQVSQQVDIGLMTIGTGLPTPGLSLYPGAYAASRRDPGADRRGTHRRQRRQFLRLRRDGAVDGLLRGNRLCRYRCGHPVCRGSGRHRHRLVGPGPGVL